MQKEINRSDQRADFEALSKEMIHAPKEDKHLEEEIIEDKVWDEMWKLHDSFGRLPK